MSFKEEPRKKLSSLLIFWGKNDFLLNRGKIHVIYVKKWIFVDKHKNTLLICHVC